MELKVIYDSTFMITESSDPRQIVFTNEGSQTNFTFQDRNWNYGYMIVKKNAFGKKQNFSFVVEFLESWPDHSIPEWDTTACLRQSSQRMKNWMDVCYGKTILREPTQEELNQIEALKRQQTGKLRISVD